MGSWLEKLFQPLRKVMNTPRLACWILSCNPQTEEQKLSERHQKHQNFNNYLPDSTLNARSQPDQEAEVLMDGSSS